MEKKLLALPLTEGQKKAEGKKPLPNARTKRVKAGVSRKSAASAKLARG